MTAADTLPPEPSAAELASRARAILEAHWQPAGYCVPHAGTYPFQWLWDSCFHAVVWAHLGEGDRAVAELTHLFRTQDELGFVPHIDYEADPAVLGRFWGRVGSSSITQPPMYGHAVAELARRGVTVPAELADRARRGLAFLLDHRARDARSGLVTLVHPWESGADDSPRWDHWCPGGFDPRRWYEVKGALLAGIVRAPSGAPLANPDFAAAPAGFNALVAFNAWELAEATGDDELRAAGDELAAAVAARLDGELGTWVDGGPGDTSSGRVRTLDGLLGALVDPVGAPAALAAAIDDDAHGGRCGPAGVHRAERAFSPQAYWRGAAWPQLTYLLWVAAERAGQRPVAERLARQLVGGAVASGWAEYWDPDTGVGLGAVPQSWAALAAVVTPGWGSPLP